MVNTSRVTNIAAHFDIIEQRDRVIVRDVVLDGIDDLVGTFFVYRNQMPSLPIEFVSVVPGLGSNLLHVRLAKLAEVVGSHLEDASGLQVLADVLRLLA